MQALTPVSSSAKSQEQVTQSSSSFLRRYSLFDVPYTALLRSVNYCAQVCLQRPLFSEEQLLTHKDRQVKEMLEVLKDKKGCDTFAQSAASFIQAALSHVAGSQMTLLPSVAGTWGRSWVRINGLFGYYAYGLVGYGALYAKDRIERGVKLDDTVRASPTVLALDRFFCRTRTYFAQYVVGNGVNYSVNFRHLVLNGLMGVDRLEKKLELEAKAAQAGINPRIPKRVSAVIESLGMVLERHTEIDKKIAEKKLDPNGDDAFIVRLEVLKKNGELPPGLPDPAEIKAGELSKKREEALLQYGKQLATWFFEKHAPDSLHRGLFGWLWWLEGEHQTIELAGPLLTEFALRQVVDPHRLYVAILTALGAETMELEHDKYGENTRERIFKTGREMMEQSLKGDASSYSILKIFSESKLDSLPGGSKVTDQKQKARAQLKKIISGMIYDRLKSGGTSIRSGSLATFNQIAEQASKLPGIGFAPIFVRGLVNGAVFTIKHIREGKDAPFAMGLIKHLAGKKQTDYLADKILELIDHPSWPVIALKVVDTMVKSFSAEEQDRIIKEEDTVKHFTTIGTFLINNAIMPLLGEEEYQRVAIQCTAGLAGGKAFEEFKNAFGTPQNVAFLETALPFIQPTIKELELYMRVTDMFRKFGVTHKDDAKFWECYIRERLYREVDPRIDETGKLRLTPNYGPTREKFVNDLMALDDTALREALSRHVNMVPLPIIKKLETEEILFQADYVDPESKKEEIPLKKSPSSTSTANKKGGWLGWW